MRIPSVYWEKNECTYSVCQLPVCPSQRALGMRVSINITGSIRNGCVPLLSSLHADIYSKAMYKFIKPQKNISIFGSLEGTAGGWVHMHWLDLCILFMWSPSYSIVNSSLLALSLSKRA